MCDNEVKKCEQKKASSVSVYHRGAVIEAAFHAPFRRCVTPSVKASKIFFFWLCRGCDGGAWCGTTLSLLTAHLSHFVSDSIHLHGPISSHVAGGCRASVFIFFFLFVQKPCKYTNICSLPNRKAVCYYTRLKMARCHHLFPPLSWVNVYMRCHIGFLWCSKAHERNTFDDLIF